mgnify:CR=1 FL=1
MTFHIINKKKNFTQEKTTLYFCAEENSEFIDENNNYRCNTEERAVAKQNHLHNSFLYYIKISNYGKLLDPYSQLTVDDEFVHAKKRLIKESYEFKTTNRIVFDMYIKYLQTKNTKWILQAEREML